MNRGTFPALPDRSRIKTRHRRHWKPGKNSAFLCWIWLKGWGWSSTYWRTTGVLPCTFAMGQKSCTKVLKPWDDWIFAVILFSMFSAAVNLAPINMCILAEKQSQNSRFGCCKPSLVKLYLFANEKMSIRFDIFFVCVWHSFIVLRNSRGPGLRPEGPEWEDAPEQPIQQVPVAGMSNENKVGILKRNILRVEFANQILKVRYCFLFIFRIY